MNKNTIFERAGLKPTVNRTLVLGILEQNDAPLSAREVWQQLSDQMSDQTMGFATVYRVLSSLCDAGLARKILSENNALYECAQEDNAPQLVCSRCGKVEEITDPQIKRYNANVMKHRGLDDNSALLLYADCRREECNNDN